MIFIGLRTKLMGKVIGLVHFVVCQQGHVNKPKIWFRASRSNVIPKTIVNT